MKKDDKYNISYIKKHIPNIISTLRIISVIPICFLYALGNYPLSTILFGLASASDFVDGFLARKWHVESKYGKYADAFGDKILVIPTILMHLVNTFSFGIESILISTMLLIEGAIGITNGISKFVKKNEVNSSIIGKIKTVVIMLTLFMSMSTLSINNSIFNFIANTIFPFVTISLQTISLKDYMNKAHKNNNYENQADNDNVNYTIEENIRLLSKTKEKTKENITRRDIINKLKEEKDNIIIHKVDNDDIKNDLEIDQKKKVKIKK